MQRGGFQRITDRVALVGGPGLTRPEDCLVYAVDGGTEVGLIDCGAGESVEQILANLDEAGWGSRPLSTLILTHRHVDHIGGAAQLVRLRGPAVIAHALDADAIEAADAESTASSWYGTRLEPTRVDRRLEGPEEVLTLGDLQLRCLHTPGHTPGSVSVTVDVDGVRVLFAQDVHGPFLPEFGSSLDRWAESMERLLKLRADILCEGHHGVFRPAEAVEAFIHKHLSEKGFGGQS